MYVSDMYKISSPFLHSEVLPKSDRCLSTLARPDEMYPVRVFARDTGSVSTCRTNERTPDSRDPLRPSYPRPDRRHAA